ncbi:MAG: glucose-1-phosphate thymidylyltransferase, partial [Culicoidibacterales bacterium]
DATNFVRTVESHQGVKIASLEEIGYINGWITKDQLIERGELMKKTGYGQYLLNVANGKIKY